MGGTVKGAPPDAVALKLGTLRELSQLTESQMLAMIHAKLRSKGAEEDGQKPRTPQEYERTKDEITAMRSVMAESSESKEAGRL